MTKTVFNMQVKYDQKPAIISYFAVQTPGGVARDTQRNRGWLDVRAIGSNDFWII